MNLLIIKGALKERQDFHGATFRPGHRTYDRKAVNADRWLQEPKRADKEPKPGDPDFSIDHVNAIRASRPVKIAKRYNELLHHLGRKKLEIELEFHGKPKKKD